MYAQYLNSQSVGGWYVAETEKQAVALAQAARETVPAAYRHLHNFGSGRGVDRRLVEWAMGGGGGDWMGRDRRLHVDLALDLTAADVSRGTGGVDFRDVEGLV